MIEENEILPHYNIKTKINHNIATDFKAQMWMLHWILPLGGDQSMGTENGPFP